MLGSVVAIGVTMVVASGALAGGPPEPKCAAAKQKAVSKLEAALLGCQSKNAAKPDAIALGACIAKSQGKFGPAFTKADLKGACVGDASTVSGQVDGCVNAVVESVPLLSGFEKCASAKLKAAGKTAGGKVGCYSKATGKGKHCSVTASTVCLGDGDCPSGESCVPTSPVDPACLGKADGALPTAFTAADAKGACPGTAVSTGATIDANCVASITNGLPAQVPNVCGNGVIEAGNNETCDDGNTRNGDGCPASCHVDTCTPTATAFGAHVTWAGGPPSTTIAGLSIFVDYPEGKVGTLSVVNGFQVSGSANNLGYGFNDSLLKLSGLPATPLTLNFKTCQGAPAAVAGDFACVVTDASDDLGNVVDPSTLTCTVTVP
jgi:cysteine-rich repeat protein